ncbi:thioredoxin [Caballeronia sp. 15711]|uniref:thioredoxin n=1 Tax=Caballeronia sp. 15711 TaxID=3391029 RepID=UPI0039E483C1
MSIADTTQNRFDSDVNGSRPVLVDFWAPWCGPCRALAPHLDTLDAKLGETLSILKVNVDDEPELAKRFQVRGIPTLLFLRDGKEEGRLTGASTARLNVLVDKWIGARHESNEGGASGAGIPGADASDDPRLSNVAAPAKRVWSSFGGRAELRDTCVARLRKLADTPDKNPFKALADTPEQLESELGIPLPCIALLNTIWSEGLTLQLNTRRELSDVVATLVAAIPPGTDLFALTQRMHFDALYQSEWALYNEIEDRRVSAVIDEMQAVHQRELDGATVSTAQWNELKKQVVMIADIDGTRDAESRMLEGLVMPLASEGMAMALGALRRWRFDDVRREPHWSADDSAVVRALEKSVHALCVETLGPPPQTPAERSEWQLRSVPIRDKWTIEQRATDSLFWARHDAYQNNIRNSRCEMVAYIRKDLASRLVALPTAASTA